MLANEFVAPLRLCRNDLQALIYEAFAHTFLAGYNTGSISSRVDTSFRRAYQATTLNSFPRVDGGRPGFVVATYREPGYDRLLVAIEGTADRWQLFAGGEALSLSNLGPDGGRVWSPPKIYSDEIIAIIADLPAYQALGNAGQVFDECWAGYSLGGAIAEISAKRRALAMPSRRLIHAYKFGAPRVGNSTWVSFTPNNYSDSAIYFGRDPIDAIPQSGLNPPSNFGTHLIVPISFLAAPLRQIRFDDQGNEIAAPELFDCLRNLQAYAELSRRGDSASPWWDHSTFLYWYALARNARNSTDNAYYRFVYLDYEDSNHAGQTFSQSSGFTSQIWGLADPAPPAYVNSEIGFTGSIFGGSLGGSPPPNIAVPAVVAQRLQTEPPVNVMQPVAQQVIRPRPNYRPRVLRPTR